MIETIVVLLHEGGFSRRRRLFRPTINSCTNPMRRRLPEPMRRRGWTHEVDVVVTGHTNWAVNCVRPDGKLVTGAASFGRARHRHRPDRQPRDEGRDLGDKVENVIVTRTVAKAPDLTTLVDRVPERSAPIANRVIGTITADITRSANTAPVSPRSAT